MGVHDDRLWAEYLYMRRFRSHVVSWQAVSGDPPDVYRFRYRLKGIIGFDGDFPRFHTGFVVQVSFPKDFPREPPTAYFVEQPIALHPNIFRDGHICWRDFRPWIPGIGVSIDWLCQIIGETIAFQVHNLYSPANGDSILRKWVQSNNQLPVDPASVRLPDAEDAIRWSEEGDSYTFVVGQWKRYQKELFSKKLRSIVIQSIITNKIVPIEEVCKSVTARELSDALESQIGMPTGTNMMFIRKSTRRRLHSLYESLGEAGIKDGEVLLADYEESLTQVPFESNLQGEDRLHNLVVVNETDGEKHFIESVPSDIAVEDLLSAFANRINLPDGVQGALIRKLTHKRVMVTQTLKSAGIANGEELLAEFETPTKLGAAEKIFERQLRLLRLTKDQIRNQGPKKLKMSLENVNDTIRNPEQFGTVKLTVNADGITVLADSSSGFNYEMGILPTLLERKRLIVECLDALAGDEEMHKSRIKILFLAANPTDTTRLSLDKEIRSIDEVLRKSEFREKFNIEQHWAVRVTDLQSLLLRHRPDIIHFSGHGSASNEIILEDSSGNSSPVSTRALSQLFSVLKDNIKCVILNACYSEQQAETIATHIDCVVGMSKAIGDSAAISFAAAFYQGLGYGRNVKTAFDLGCLQIDLENLGEQDTPKLLALKSAPDHITFVRSE